MKIMKVLNGNRKKTHINSIFEVKCYENLMKLFLMSLKVNVGTFFFLWFCQIGYELKINMKFKKMWRLENVVGHKSVMCCQK